jgi:DnaA family protein
LGQLPLQLALPDHASFETFVSGGNTTAVEHVRSLARGSPGTVWLWGSASAGKSHLLQAACRAATAAGRRAMYVPLPAESPAVLVDLEQVELLAIDNLDSVAGNLDWERPLFAIFNAYLAGQGSLLLAANAPAAQCGFSLPDLASRGAGAVTYRVGQLDDTERAAALRLHAAARGLVLEPAAADFLLKRAARDMAALTAWLTELDRASLTEQRRLTIPFIRALLARSAANAE